MAENNANRLVAFLCSQETFDQNDLGERASALYLAWLMMPSTLADHNKGFGALTAKISPRLGESRRRC